MFFTTPIFTFLDSILPRRAGVEEEEEVAVTLSREEAAAAKILFIL